jgi:hypothetical protein
MRSLFHSLISVAAIAALCIFSTGCNDQQTIASLLQAAGAAVSSVATIENDPALASKLTTDFSAASQAVLAWKAGTPAQDVVEALDLVEQDLSLFPVNSQEVVLIDLAIGTVEAIIVAIEPSAANSAAIVARSALSVHLATPPKNAKAFKAQWQALINANPALSKYALK